MRKKTGLVLSTVSPFDYRIVASKELPVAWSAPVLPVIGNQAVQNCMNWAVSYCHEMACGMTFSKGYLYGERLESDWQGEGVIPAQLLQAAVKHGNVLSTAWPREDEVPTAQSSVSKFAETLRAAAAKYPIKAYYLCSSVDDIKTARMAGLGVVFGALIDRPNCDDNNVFRAETGHAGAHAMTIIDWSDTYPAYWRVANSWSDKWGHNGFCYMSTADVLRSGMVYAIEFANVNSSCPNCPTDGFVILPNDVPKPIGRRTLKYTYPRMKDGDGYTDVSEFQTLCNKVGISTPIDGYYGTVARNACYRLQQLLWPNMLDEHDGIVAGNTWAALDKAVVDVDASPENSITDDEDPGVQYAPVMQLIEWAKEQLGQMYLLGAQGEKVYDGMSVNGKVYANAIDWIRYRERASDEHYYRALAFYNILVSKGKTPILAYDCSGLLVCWLLKNGFIEQDMTAHGLYNLCKRHKPMTTDRKQCKPGWFCFTRKWTGEVYHVGLYIGPFTYNGVFMQDAVIESKGREDGVVVRNLNKGEWNRFSVLPVLDEV